jgi:hypothetical protein
MNDTQSSVTVLSSVMMSVAFYRNAESRYAEYHYSECCGAHFGIT